MKIVGFSMIRSLEIKNGLYRYVKEAKYSNVTCTAPVICTGAVLYGIVLYRYRYVIYVKYQVLYGM